MNAPSLTDHWVEKMTKRCTSCRVDHSVHSRRLYYATPHTRRLAKRRKQLRSRGNSSCLLYLSYTILPWQILPHPSNAKACKRVLSLALNRGPLMSAAAVEWDLLFAKKSGNSTCLLLLSRNKNRQADIFAATVTRLSKVA